MWGASGGRQTLVNLGCSGVFSACVMSEGFVTCKSCGSPASCWQRVLSLTHPLTWFEHVSMLVILLNCVTLGMFQPCEDVECQSERCTILEVRPALSWDPSHPQDTQKALHVGVVSAVRHTWVLTVTLQGELETCASLSGTWWQINHQDPFQPMSVQEAQSQAFCSHQKGS